MTSKLISRLCARIGARPARCTSPTIVDTSIRTLSCESAERHIYVKNYVLRAHHNTALVAACYEAGLWIPGVRRHRSTRRRARSVESVRDGLQSRGNIRADGCSERTRGCGAGG